MPSLASENGQAGQPPPSGIVSLRQVSRTYRIGLVEVPALIEVSLEVADGEFVAIVGPSGSGKTTMMNILGCLDRPTGGSYLFDSVPVADLDDDQLALVRSRSIGFVFQNYSLLPRTTALDNVAAPLLYQGVPTAERRRRAHEALERVQLADRVNHQPSELSGGQQQRVAIARAIVTEPRMLLADEPTGNLDSHSGAEVMALLRELNATGRTVVLITHEEAVARAADRHITLLDGRVAA